MPNAHISIHLYPVFVSDNALINGRIKSACGSEYLTWFYENFICVVMQIYEKIFICTIFV